MREVITDVVGHGVSERKACEHLGVSRASMRYEGKGPDPEAEALRGQVKDLALKHRRYGYRRITRVMRRLGLEVNYKRVYRYWRQAELALPRRKPRKKTRTPWVRKLQAETLNRLWAIDFVADRTCYGAKLRMLTVIDEHTRECLAIQVGWRMPSVDVIAVLEELVLQRGAPVYIRCDNGPEFIAEKLNAWAEGHGITIAHTDPGSPWQNGFNESFNGKFRDECLNQEVFLSRIEAQVVVEWWRRSYNEERPHSSLGYRTPAEVAAAARLGGQRGENNPSLN
jgi:putative transposase